MEDTLFLLTANVTYNKLNYGREYSILFTCPQDCTGQGQPQRTRILENMLQFCSHTIKKQQQHEEVYCPSKQTDLETASMMTR